jgi:hypothetical protein
MSEECEMLAKCAFFLEFGKDSEVVKQGWIRTFCENREKSKDCKRKQVSIQTGKPPADNMSPSGTLL